MTIPPEPIPPLEPGDHLSRNEFERRYDAMPHLKKAELIEGVVYMPSPVRHDGHGLQHSALLGWLVLYWSATPGTQPSDNSTVRLDLDNEPQPDALLLIEPRCGGQARIRDGYIEAAPELVAEVTASSASIDLNLKLRIYRRNGVREYIVWRVRERAIDWFVLDQGQFVPLAPQGDGTLHSPTFPGLWLDPQALVQLQMPRVLQVLQQGIASPEHAGFVAHLNPSPPSP
jgi:Uma2 family endonuclease